MSHFLFPLLNAASFISHSWFRSLHHTLQFTQPHSATHSKRISFLIPLLSHCSMQFCLSASLQAFNSIRNTHQPFVFSHRPKAFWLFINPNHWFFPFNSIANKKNAPNLCAYCIGRSLAFRSSAISSSTFAQLAVGSRTSLASFHCTSFRSFRLLHKLQLPLRRATGLPFICSPKPYSVGFAEGSFSFFSIFN